MSMTERSTPVEPPPPLQHRSVQAFILLASIAACIFFACRVPSPVGLKRIRQPRILLDLNSASVRELSLLPGIGPVLAKRIVQNRRRQGNFESVQALQRVYGIGPKTVTRAEVFCIVDEHELRLAYR